MKQIFTALFLLLSLLFSPFAGFSEVREIICEGEYHMGDNETPIAAESRVLLSAKRVAIEQAGTYVESYSDVRDSQLTADEIKVLASGLTEVVVVDKKRSVIEEGFHFWVKIKARVSPNKMQEMIKKAKDKSIVEDYKDLHDAYDKSLSEIAELKKQLATSKNKIEKHKVVTKIAHNEKQLRAHMTFEEGLKHSLHDEHDKAIEAYTATLELEPEYDDAYHNRGTAYHKKGHHDNARDDFKKACDLGEKYACENLKKL